MSHNRTHNKSKHTDRVLEAVEDGSGAAKSSIAASWNRSFRLHGLAPDQPSSEQRFSSTELEARREKSGRLLQISMPTIERLFTSLKLAGCSVVLCDADGVILENLRSDGDATAFDAAGLTAGSVWSEQAQGTNGIGTCIAEGRLTTILRDQHFRADNIGMSCFGAPVFNSVGSLQAVLDVSTCREQLEPALEVLIGQTVQDAATRIETDHFCDEFSGFRIVQARPSEMSGPALLAVDPSDLVVGATRSARRSLGLPLDSDFSPRPAADLIGDADDRGTGFENAERRELKRALAKANGNMSEAARALGVSRATLYRRVAKLGIDTSQT